MTELHDQRPLSRVELVVLARLTAVKGATETEIAQSLRDIGVPFADAALADSVTATLASLGARALVERSVKPSATPPKPSARPRKPSTSSRKSTKPAPAPRVKLTEAGRVALRDVFGGKAKPTWTDMLGRVIPALALGEQPGTEAAARALTSPEAMRARLLRRDRTLGELTTVVELCDRIIARALGMPQGAVTIAGIRAYALAMHAGGASKAELEGLSATFAPAKATKAVTPAKLEVELKAFAVRLVERQAHIECESKATMLRSLQRRWLRQQDEADDAQRPSALRSTPLGPPRPAAAEELPAGSPSHLPAQSSDAAEALLLAVREAIPLVGSGGRYGKDNVFISALWRQVARDRRLAALSLDGFKRWLVTANRDQLLALARADLVDDMDAHLVEDSEIEYLGATFHFVLDRRGPPGASAQVIRGR
jgi:hypothetical protein